MKKNGINVKRVHLLIVITFVCVLALFTTVKVFTYVTTNAEGPAITFDKDEIRVKTSVKEKKLLEGVTAVDEKGNDVTDTVMIESFSKLLDGKKRIVIILLMMPIITLEKRAERLFIGIIHRRRSVWIIHRNFIRKTDMWIFSIM